MIRCNMRRTRSSLIVIVATCVLCLARVTICDENSTSRKSADNGEIKIHDKSIAGMSNDAIEHIKNNNNSSNTAVERQIGKNITPQSVSTNVDDKSVAEHTSSPPEPNKDVHQPTVNSGALLRGFYVLAGLSVIALAYMVFRSFGLNKQRPQMVRKYGILAHKQDIEMRPLPLDEDDDDDTTVFDVSGLAPSRAQS